MCSNSKEHMTDKTSNSAQFNSAVAYNRKAFKIHKMHNKYKGNEITQTKGKNIK
jgi:hypothetical protein